MSGALTLRTRVIKNGVKLHGMKNPIFLPGPVEPRYSKYLTFEGISVDDAGKQYHLDAAVSFRQACYNCIEYFKKFGYSGEQVSHHNFNWIPRSSHHIITWWNLQLL
jgi:formamidase